MKYIQSKIFSLDAIHACLYVCTYCSIGGPRSIPLRWCHQHHHHSVSRFFFFPFFPTNKTKKNLIITSACYFALGSGATTHPDWLPPSATTLQSLLPLLSPGSTTFEAFSNIIETWEFGRLLNIGASAVHMTASVSPNVSRQPALTVKHENLPFSAL